MRALWILGLAACTSAPAANPAQFWIATDGSEQKLRLAPVEPIPF